MLLKLDFTLPIADPVLKFLIVIFIILLAPLLLNRIKIPHLIGLLLAGAFIGPNGLNILERDSAIVVTGTTGLLYIMFLAGLEIDLIEFRKNSGKSLIFGMYTFIIPITLGTLGSKYILGFNWMSSILVGSLIASHTLLSYPIVSKLGVAKNRAVNITVGGTMITDTLALLVLAVIVGMTKGEVGTSFWITMIVSLLIFGFIVLFVFPIIARWFFKTVNDKIAQFVFVLVMLYLGSVLAEIAGVEAIIGAFLTGLSLNRLISHTSPLMNRIEFMGNAYFIPIFLISVGMLINFKAFISSTDTLLVAAVMCVGVITGKYLAAWLAGKSFSFSKAEIQTMFGLSLAQAAATLAAVLVGYNIILYETPEGEPVRLLNESVLNGSILMILVTCTIASLITQKGATGIAENSTSEEADSTSEAEKFLVATNDLEKSEGLTSLALGLRSKSNPSPVHLLSIINKNEAPDESDKAARKVLQSAMSVCSGADVGFKDILRFDESVVQGITGEAKLNKISDIVMGYSHRSESAERANALVRQICELNKANVFVYNPAQPISTVDENIIVLPSKVEEEQGFYSMIAKLWNLAKNTGMAIKVYGDESVKPTLDLLNQRMSVSYSFHAFTEWEDILILWRELRNDTMLTIFVSSEQGVSWNPKMPAALSYLHKYLKGHNFIIAYPQSAPPEKQDPFYIRGNHLMNPVLDLEDIGKDLKQIWK